MVIGHEMRKHDLLNHLITATEYKGKELGVGRGRLCQPVIINGLCSQKHFSYNKVDGRDKSGGALSPMPIDNKQVALCKQICLLSLQPVAVIFITQFLLAYVSIY